MSRISKESLKRWVVSGCVTATILTGCGPVDRFRAWRDSTEVSYYQNFVTQIEYPEVQTNPQPEAVQTINPLALENPADLPTFDLTLQDAIRLALESSDVLRNLSGTVVQAPLSRPTEFEPALVELNPLAGTQAALAAFDATVNSQLFWQKLDQPLNQQFGGGGGIGVLFPGVRQGTQGTMTNQIQKRTATGATFALRYNVLYDRNQVAAVNGARLFPSAFSGSMEAEWRQPMMRGAGTTYNRIAGPNAGIGQYNGILIARINTDVSLADFESGVIQLVNDVETAYWELYFAYRALEAQISGRESSRKAWQFGSERVEAGLDAKDTEAQSRSNYYQFVAQVNDRLSGTDGLYAAEQRLRYMIGFSATDGRLIRPSSDPLQAMVMFDWQSALNDAITRRVEVRRQEWNIKRRELELIAARLNRRPQFDALSQYRLQGLGDHLAGNDGLFGSLGTMDYQEWRSGLEWSYPVGLRQASAAVRHAQLTLARDMTVLEEQQLRISHDLSFSARQIARSYEQLQINYNRVQADIDQVDALFARYKAGRDNIRFWLQAQQQLAASQSAFYRSLIDYNLAVRDFHREKGSLLTYNQVGINEETLNGSVLGGAYQQGRFFTPRDYPEAVRAPAPVSGGSFDPSSIGVPYSTAPMELVSPQSVNEPMTLESIPGVQEINVAPPPG